MVADDERGAILNWLAKTGYPLELHVAKAFSDRSLLLRQSLPYADPIEVGKLREADVIVDVVDRLPGYGFWNFSLVVECKHAQSGKPWIAFTTGSDHGNFDRLSRSLERSAVDQQRWSAEGGAKCLAGQLALRPVAACDRRPDCTYGFRRRWEAK